MAAVLALMRSSVVGPTLGLSDRSDKSGTLEILATFASERRRARRAGHHLLGARSGALRQRPGAVHVNVAALFKCFTRDSFSQSLEKLCLRENGPASQDAASAHEIALGVAFGSLLPDGEVISSFALTFDGYKFWGSTGRCAEIANARAAGTLAELRTCLFFEQRRHHHFGRPPTRAEMKYLRQSVAKIRQKLRQHPSAGGCCRAPELQTFPVGESPGSPVCSAEGNG